MEPGVVISGFSRRSAVGPQAEKELSIIDPMPGALITSCFGNELLLMAEEATDI